MCAKKNDTAVSVPAFDKVVNDNVLVAFTDQVVENDILVVYRKPFERDDFVTGSFNDLITHLRVDLFIEVLKESLVLALVQVR